MEAIKIFQINCKNSIAASEEIINYGIINKVDLILVQEYHISKKWSKIQHKTYFEILFSHEKTRNVGIINFNKNIKILKISQYSSEH